MIPFAETITSKEELIKVAKIGYDNYTNRKVTKNDFLVYFGFTHGEAITKFYPDNNYQVLLDAGFNTGSEAYFSAGINAWKNLKDGSYIFPPLYCNDNLINLRPGDSDDVIFITSEDSLCFYVLSESKNSSGLRTISKDLLREFIKYEISNPESSAHDARIALSGKSYIDKYEYGYEGTLWRLAKLNKTVPNRKVEAFAHSVVLPKSIDGPLQKIVYGAPGTGKSFGTDGEIKKIYPTKEAEKDKVFRTTFHPDSDYSTFVGCYKPMAIKKEDEVYGVQKLREMYNVFRTKYPSHNISRFVGLYYKSFLQLTNEEAFAVFKGFSADTTIDNILSNAIPQAEISGELTRDCSSTITYDFTPQSFTKAYIAAWKTLLKGEKKPVFLVIEEINRGNCAQIFGDLFQLLDRTDGFSTYSIKPDTDLGDYIKGEFAKEGLTSEKYDSVVQGEELILPNNLFIWATMNTSDQSLFPIDSAFKRRWDWKYVPINTEAKNGWKIVVDGKNYSWSSFLDKINDEIDTTTSSEDKQLGFFFCKADDTDEDDNNGTISAEKFVGKVLFYIYNDVFKDYGLDQEFFKDKENADKKISFRSLFKMNGDINETQVAKILDNLGVEKLDLNSDAIVDEDNIEADDSDDSNDKIKLTIKFPDGEVVAENTKFDSYLAALKKIGLDKTEEIASKKKYHRLGCALISKNQESVIIDAANYSYVEEQGFYIIKGANGKTMRNMLNLLSRELDLNLEVGYE